MRNCRPARQNSGAPLPNEPPTPRLPSGTRGLTSPPFMNTRSLRLAMWSGPRNISTAMMRSWGNRADTFVSDEPLYAHYLAHTRKAHQGADEIIARYETDWRQVVAQLTGPIPGGK